MPDTPAIAIRFQALPKGQVFYALTAPSPALQALGLPSPGMFNPQVGWLPPSSFQATTPLPLSTTWTAGGVYFFLGMPLANETVFAAAWREIASNPQFQTARLVWIANPNDRPDLWRLWSIRLGTAQGAQAIVAAQANFDFRNQLLTVNAGSTLTLVDSGEQSGFQINPPAGSSDAIDFSGLATSSVFIPLWDSAGCLQFPFHLDSTDTLDVGIRYSFAGKPLLGQPRLTSFRYPVFVAGFDLNATLDPIAPLDSSRSFFEFPLAPTQKLASCFCTNSGHPLLLTPASGARLLFAPRPTYPTPGTSDPLYLVPDGPFAIEASATPPIAADVPVRLLCGIFGAEFIELDAAAHITFAAGQPAHLFAFQPGQPLPTGSGDAGSQLSTLTTTSSAVVHSANFTLNYSAVPEGAGFFKTAGSSLLEYFPAVAAFLPSAGPEDGLQTSAPYPLLPYTGVQNTDTASLQALESQIFAPMRRNTIHRNQAPTINPPPTGDSAPVTTLTPQGLQATFDAQHDQWTRLQIAQSGTTAAPSLLAFQNIDDPLRSALLTNQQFLVISDAGAFGRYFAANNIVMLPAGQGGFWTFVLDPQQWATFGTILVIKNSARPLTDLIDDLNLWTLGSSFNRSLSTTQQSLKDIRDAALATGPLPADQAPTAPSTPDANATQIDPFLYFRETVLKSPDWNGILFLRCLITVGGLPDDLQGLAGGIDPARFFAHHLGINQTPVVMDAQGNPAPGQTSIFGLISYVDSSPLPSFGDFEFRARSLSVVFKNSVIESFSSEAEFGIGKLFGALPGNGPVVIPLKGTYEQHGDSQVFAMVGDTGSTTIDLNDAILSRVVVDKTHLSTSVTSAGEIDCRLDIWGHFNFASLNLDIFSYDVLSFSKLGVTMSFLKATPQTKAFLFNPSGLAFDASQSVARPTSLAARFPLTLKSFLVSTGDGDPTSGGFLEVGLPFPGVAAPWYGLLFNLDLGTVGALAANAGIVADFAVIWSAGAASPSAFAGLKLPLLSGGHNKMSLLGVLSLSMSSVDLLQDPSGGFLLALNGMTLKFLSKSLPPGASFDFYLFGDPNGSNKLGWYGAYVRDQG